MRNLLQENIELESQRTNCTFVFFADTQANAKKIKEQFFANAHQKRVCIGEKVY